MSYTISKADAAARLRQELAEAKNDSDGLMAVGFHIDRPTFWEQTQMLAIEEQEKRE